MLAQRVGPVALAVVASALGATLLPFWPPVLVAAIVAAAALGAWVHPRIGLAVALAAPLFPIGNHAESAAVLYCGLALAWLLLSWRGPRSGLLFIAGPLLAPVGLLALVPLIVQASRGTLLRGAQAALAVLAAALFAGLAGDDLPLAASRTGSLGIGPQDSARDVAFGLWSELVLHPAVLGGAVVAAAAAALLSWAARRSRHGVAAIGGALVVCAAASGTGIAGLLVAGLVWAVAANVAAGTAR
jgi:hypothetical protein